MSFDVKRIAAMIDHTCLKADATSRDIDRLCREALRFGFCCVCVNGAWVAHCAAELRGSAVKVASTAGFPLGAGLTRAKAFEAEAAAAAGAAEIDMVMSVGRFLEEKYGDVRRDIAEVVEAVRGGAIVKVILETGYLNEEQIRAACEIAASAGAHFVKTSTGFGPGGASARHVALMRAAVPPSVGVKAAGGIRTFADAVRMAEAGASRIGTSAGAAIMADAAGGRPGAADAPRAADGAAGTDGTAEGAY